MTRSHTHRSTVAAAVLAVILTALSTSVLWAQNGRSRSDSPRATRPNGSSRGSTAESPSPLDEPIRLAGKAAERFRTIDDYTCTFIKRERIKGKLLPMEFVDMKVRNEPFSVYMKWRQPHTGREAIYVKGENDDKLLVHSTGVGRFVAGTLSLDPKGDMALANSRHPITDAGLGHLVEQLATRWQNERAWGQSQVEIKSSAKVDDRVCWLVKTSHPQDTDRYEYGRTSVYFDKESGLPIRFEGYDWPRAGGQPGGDLLEEFTYRDLKFNVSLTARDFSTENPEYNFGRL